MKDIEKALGRADTKRPVIRRADRSEATPTAFAGVVTQPEPGSARASAPAQTPILNADYAAFRAMAGGESKRSEHIDGAFRALRTQVMDAVRVRNLRAIGITSAKADAGKSVTAIQLALACARRDDRTTYLADFDYRRPSIAKYLSASNFRPSTAFFQSNDAISDYISESEQGNLRFFLNDEATDLSAEYLASSRMDDALAAMTKQRDAIVIADLPPVLGCDDTMAILPKLDGVIVVAESGKNSYSDLEQMMSHLPKDKIIAAVLNRVPSVDTKKYNYSYTATGKA